MRFAKLLRQRPELLSLAVLLIFSGALRAAESSAVVGGSKAHKDQAFTEFFGRTAVWRSGDGALFVPLADGRVLCLFGDSHIDDFDPKAQTTPCLFQVRNAGLIQETNGMGNVGTLIGAGPGSRTWFKDSTTADEWFWPVCGFQEGKSIY